MSDSVVIVAAKRTPIGSMNGQLVGLSRDDAGFGTTQSGVTAGIQHRF